MLKLNYMNTLFKNLYLSLVLFAAAVFAAGAEEYPVSFALSKAEGNAAIVKVSVKGGAYLYAGFTVNSLAPSLPPPEKNALGEDVYKKSFEFFVSTPPPLTIDFQCCDRDVCYPPLRAIVTERDYKVGDAFSMPAAAAPKASLPFKEVRRSYGYLSPKDLLTFLNGQEEQSAAPAFGLLALLMLFVGGFLLNLTPCVLPVIPMTLAVLGAKYDKAGPKRGFLLGSVYGLGMCLTYGTLGAVAIFLGGSFGTWYDLWYFRAILALLFIALGLAMMDLFILDWSRFIGRPQSLKEKKGSLWGAFMLGVLAALLAGACIAPVIVYTLVQGAELYNKGNYFGIALPFILGLGLASPWPFLGAGVSFLPKPGNWMNWLKKLMGVVLILLGIYYALAIPRLFKAENYSAKESEKLPGYYYNDSISAAFEKSKAEKKPLVVDMSATWCASCKKMDRKTFRDPEVRKVLTNDFVFLSFTTDLKAENEDLKNALDTLKPQGLPAVIILEP